MIAQERLHTFDVSIISGGKVSLSCTNTRHKALFWLFACQPVELTELCMLYACAYTDWTMHSISYTQLHTSWLQHNRSCHGYGDKDNEAVRVCISVCICAPLCGVHVRCTWCIPSLQAYALCMYINMIMSLKEFSPQNHFNCQSFDSWLFGNSHAFKSE